ncbi:S1C family serine protease [Amnibacterium endophyticum]|uniref:S1C family serine protease n=1 Tax=Amnibacterium endophyticum TaxID=2109337 RepID=A0ABW4L9K9_9MICO
MSDDFNRPEEPRSETTADGGHLHEDGTDTRAEPVTTTVADDREGAAFRRSRERRGLVVPVVAAAVVAALIGGGLGAGIAIAVNQPTSAVSTSNANGSGAGVVINNPSTATAVSAVAAKASPSVVTIQVAASNESGTGSGIVLSSDGYVLTNNHVVTLDGDSSSGTISVTTTDGHLYKAKIVGTDPLNDLAVIKLENASGLTAATFADSSDLNVGDSVVAIGAPLNLPNTVTTGIVSALNRSIAVASSAVPEQGQQDQGQGQGQGESPFNFWNFGNGNGNGNGGQQSQAQTSNIYLSVLQTDAAINPGNSGGALLDSQGRVIGVNVAIAGTGSSTGGQSGSIGVGFAIPSNIAKRIADELIKGEQPTHGQIGIESPSNQTATSGDVAGVPVSTVTSGGPAAKAGIQKGDVITAVGGVPTTAFTDLAAQVRAYPGGSTVEVTWSRNGQSKTGSVTLGTVKAAS